MTKGRRKILVVDDDRHIVRLLREKLSAPGRLILEAVTGLEAIKTSLREVPDLLILDVMMPRIDGYQVCRFLRSVPALRRTRILFLTVRHGAGDRQRGLLGGGDDFLTKPFEMDDLERKVADLLGRRRAAVLRDSSLAPGMPIPPPEEITDEIVVALMNSMLDESVHRLTLLEKVSRRLVATVDRDEILMTMLAAAVCPVGLGWDRALLMAIDEEKGLLEAEMAFALAKKPEEGLSDWRDLTSAAKDRTLGELLDEGMKVFPFRRKGTDRWIDTLRLSLDVRKLESPGDSAGEVLDLLGRACRVGRPDTYLSRIFHNPDVTVVPVAGKDRIFGLLAADRRFSHGGVRIEEVDHLRFLGRQAGLALERQLLHRQAQSRALEYERLSLLSEGVINGIELGVVFLDNDGKVGTWNRAMANFTGLKEEAASGRPFFELFPDLQVTFVEERFRQSRDRQSSSRVGHFPHAFRKGKKGVFDIRFGTVRQRGKIIGTVMIWEDVELRVTLERRAVEAHRYLENLVSHSGDAILTVDGRGKIRSWNGGAGEIFGYEASEIVGRGFSTLFGRANRAGARRLIEETYRLGKVVNDITTLLHKEGDPIEVSITTSIVSEGDEDKGDVAAIIRDVTERRRMESQLLQTEKLASLGILAAGMAHEINNPLTSILMYTQILGMRPDIGEDERNCIERIEEDSGRIADIVNSLLVFSRPSTRKAEEVDLHGAIEKAISFVRYQTGRKRISVSCLFCEKLPPLTGTTTEIQEIFLNLLLNARDALPDGGEIRLASRYHPPGTAPPPGVLPLGGRGFVEVQVVDNGSGICRENLGRIYDPFFTTKPPGKGTGLGLAVVRRLVEIHGGSITVRSDLGRGTTFTLYLPVG